MLVDNSSLVQELHYGPHSHFWWDFSTENNTVNFPIRLGQKVKVFLNGNDFFLRVIKGANNLPEYYCISDQVEAIEASSTKAISTVYVNIFKNSTRYSGHTIMGWNNENILEKLKNDVEFFPITCLFGKYKIFLYAFGYFSYEEWNHARPGFKFSIIHTFEKQ